jgi:hypothetical protein
MNHQFYLDEEDYIVLEALWDDEIVQTMRFKNKGTLTGEGKKVVGRPSLGITKKVSLTLPDELWAMIEEQKEKWNLNQSQTLRKMIEGHFGQ